MARPIKETPILTGKDAQRFEKAIKNNEKNPVSPTDCRRIIDAWNRFKVISHQEKRG